MIALFFCYSEIYATYARKTLATYLSYPDCHCPREYTDSFGFMALNKKRIFRLDDRLCYKAITGINNRYSEARYIGFGNGKWAIFHWEWISDFTDHAEITITMPPSMLVSIYFIVINLMTKCFPCIHYLSSYFVCLFPHITANIVIFYIVYIY